MKMVPDQIARYVPGAFTTLGTDGFGRSDSRTQSAPLLRDRRRPRRDRGPVGAGAGRASSHPRPWRTPASSLRHRSRGDRPPDPSLAAIACRRRLPATPTISTCMVVPKDLHDYIAFEDPSEEQDLDVRRDLSSGRRGRASTATAVRGSTRPRPRRCSRVAARWEPGSSTTTTWRGSRSSPSD